MLFLLYAISNTLIQTIWSARSFILPTDRLHFPSQMQYLLNITSIMCKCWPQTRPTFICLLNSFVMTSTFSHEVWNNRAENSFKIPISYYSSLFLLSPHCCFAPTHINLPLGDIRIASELSSSGSNISAASNCYPAEISLDILSYVVVNKISSIPSNSCVNRKTNNLTLSCGVARLPCVSLSAYEAKES